MSALALIAKSRGVSITGCDANPGGAPEVAELGVPVAAGHDESHVRGARAVVYTAAVPQEATMRISTNPIRLRASIWPDPGSPTAKIFHARRGRGRSRCG